MNDGIVALVDGLLQAEGDARPGKGHLDQQGSADQGGHSDAGNREHRQQGIGKPMAQHHLRFTQSSAAGRLDIVTPQGAPEVEAQRRCEGAAQQQGQSSSGEHKVPDGAPQSSPIQGNHAVNQIKTAALRGHQAGGKAASYREPTQTDGEQQLHQHRHPERGECVGAETVETSSEIELAFRACDTAEANAQANDGCNNQGHHTQLKAGREGSADDAADRFLVDQPLTEVALDQAMQVVEVLIQQ